MYPVIEEPPVWDPVKVEMLIVTVLAEKLTIVGGFGGMIGKSAAMMRIGSDWIPS